MHLAKDEWNKMMNMLEIYKKSLKQMQNFQTVTFIDIFKFVGYKKSCT